ncbi:TPA: magnesium transporter, partial [Neisseria meningitidis]
MSIEPTPPNLENDGIENDVERVSADFDRVHSLCEILEPAFEQIENGTPLEDAPLRDKLTELTVLLSELHPADVAAVLESLPPRERNIVWILVKPEDDGEVLLEVSDAVRETLIESMDKDELLAAVD